MGTDRDRRRRPRDRRAQRAGMALDGPSWPGWVDAAGAWRPQRRAAVPARHGGVQRAASLHGRRDTGHRRGCVAGRAAVERRHLGAAGADGHARGREAAQAVGGAPRARLHGVPLPFGPCGRRDRAGPQPGADRALLRAAVWRQDGRRRVHGPARAGNGLGSHGRDGAPVVRRRRRGGDGGGGDPGRRPRARPWLPSRRRLSPGRTPRAPSPGSPGSGRTAGRARAPAGRPRRRRPGSCPWR